ncbi:hypothetical protein BHK98_08245 [Hornefia porci]|uniref:Ferredoxin n=1 Tax=Hornefia porci TaxID=2652292 RepID=A0A1Q9JIT5_9FIRM|nr:hypothetical protein [Hornefia porci]OLR56051.1 hypothetical protein BHK98_08245 [Hornefia porci]
MVIRKIAAAYFSAAGGTKEVTERIAAKLAEQYAAETGEIGNENAGRDAAETGETGAPEVRTVDFTLPCARTETFVFDRETLVVFGTPTYAGRVPNKVLPMIRELFRGNGAQAVAVVTFGNRNFDSSLTELTQELSGLGFVPVAGAAVACRHVFSKKIAPGRPDAEDLAKVDRFAEQVKTKLDDASAAGMGTAEIALIAGREEVGPYYTPLGRDGLPAKFLKAKVQTNLIKCDDCGICARVCPLGSIDVMETSRVPGICIKCHACVVNCPQGAKYFGDTAFLSHVAYLEEHCQRRAEPEFFL